MTTMMRSWNIAVVIGLALWSAGALAQPDDQAKELFRRGREFYEQGQYEEAIGAFKSAGEIRPSPILDYNIARCHDKLGNSREAIEGYESYLKAMPGAANRQEVEQRIAALKQAPEAAKQDSPGSPEPPPSATPPADPPRAEEPSAPVPPPSRVEEPGAPGVGLSGPVHEATQAEPPVGKKSITAAGRGGSRPQPYRAPGKPDEGPFYKQWWFWVGCAGGAVILGFVIATAVSSDDGGGTSQRAGGLRISF